MLAEIPSMCSNIYYAIFIITLHSWFLVKLPHYSSISSEISSIAPFNRTNIRCVVATAWLCASKNGGRICRMVDTCILKVFFQPRRVSDWWIASPFRSDPSRASRICLEWIPSFLDFPDFLDWKFPNFDRRTGGSEFLNFQMYFWQKIFEGKSIK